MMPVFEFRDDDVVPNGYKHIDCRMFFDVKIVGLVRKARFMAVGHQTIPPSESTYSSVVIRISVRFALLLAVLPSTEGKGLHYSWSRVRGQVKLADR